MTALDEPWVDDMTTQSEVSEAPGLARSVVRRSGLRNLRQVRPLIDQVLTRPSATVLVGATGTGKTFLALGFSCSIATGRDWLGHSVTPGPVLYVVGEGASGLDARLAAWEEAWNRGAAVPDDRLVFVVKPGSLNSHHTWWQLTELAHDMGAVLVVIDTLSSTMPDADEVKDAPAITRRLSDLAAAIDGCVLLVHHPGWSDSTRVRGGYQLEANVDEVLVLATVTEGSEVLTLTRKKVKEGPAGRQEWLRRKPRGSSLIIEGALAKDAEVPMRARILATLAALGDVGGTGPQLLAEVGADGSGRSSFYKSLRALVEQGDADQDGKTYRLSRQGAPA